MSLKRRLGMRFLNSSIRPTQGHSETSRLGRYRVSSLTILVINADFCTFPTSTPILYGLTEFAVTICPILGDIEYFMKKLSGEVLTHLVGFQLPVLAASIR